MMNFNLDRGDHVEGNCNNCGATSLSENKITGQEKIDVCLTAFQMGHTITNLCDTCFMSLSYTLSKFALEKITLKNR